jgi:hypothetical protein
MKTRDEIVHRIRVLAAALAVASACAAPSLHAQGKASIDEDKIYYGNVRSYSRPATVDAARVYREIPAHREIIDRKLTRHDPDYWPLMRKASQAFVKALRKACKEKGYDLVAEVNAIRVQG